MSTHWEKIYTTRMAEKLGWYQSRLGASLDWIADLGLARDAAIIDVGGGASTLVDDLVDEGYEYVTVLDVAGSALDISRKRLGRQQDLVMWLTADVTEYPLPRHHFDLWHDRATFHFLVDRPDREAYLRNLGQALKPGGYAILLQFSPEAPPTCAGMPVMRYSHESLAAALGAGYELLRHGRELHVTPTGIEQEYLCCLFRKSESHGPGDG